MNDISKTTSKIINKEIIDLNNGKIVDNYYLGILNYYCSKYILNKKIISKILIHDFMNIFNDKLINNDYMQNYNSADVIHNLTNIIISIDKYLKKI